MKYSETHPLETEKDYPYVSKDGKCSYDKSKGVVAAKSYNSVTKNSPSQLKAALHRTPVAISVASSSTVFHHYTGGVITSSSCGT